MNTIKENENLKDYMQRIGKSQREVAKAIGVTEVALSYYANGKRTPKIFTACEMTKVLDLSINDVCKLLTNSKKQMTKVKKK